MRFAIALAFCVAAQGQTDLLMDVRIALRLSNGQVLIVGKEDEGLPYDLSTDDVPPGLANSPFQPVKFILPASPDYMTRFRNRADSRWRLDAGWKLYTGAGAAMDLAILSTAGRGDGCGTGGFSTALARFADPSSAQAALGLRASEYLADPGAGLANVSQASLTVADTRFREFAKIEMMLLDLGRRAVGNERWKAQRSDRARQMNQAFLESKKLRFQARVQRWSPPGGAPLLLVECTWTDNKGKPLFGANAVVEESATATVLAFDPGQGESMRSNEIMIGGGDWLQSGQWVFRNAWAIENRRFVLMYTVLYEGFRLELKEIVPGKGFVDTGIGYRAGC